MVYDSTIRRNVGSQNALTDEQAELLTRLERVKQPTEWQRGQIAALRLSTPQQDEVARAEEVRRRWETRPSGNSEDLDAGGLL